MAKFVLMFHGGETPEEPSPEVMDRWMAWFGELGEAVVDMGAPFGRCDGRVGWNAERGDRAGPGERLHGHRGGQLHDAVVMAKGCPGLSSGGSVKLYEAMQMGDGPMSASIRRQTSRPLDRVHLSPTIACGGSCSRFRRSTSA